MFEHRLREKNIALTFHSEIDSAWVDARLLFVVLRNLVDNSIKFVPENTGSVRVSVTREQEGLVLAVEDNGCGIPPEDQPRVFERFYQVDKSRSGNTGTGLGLSIVKHATAAMGGTVQLTSVSGTGTTVRVLLPRALINAAG
jgi:signal transduction histidine kinase